jgi:VanZ family protein
MKTGALRPLEKRVDAGARILDASPADDRRILRVSLVVWCLFVLYGSFLPFHFSADSGAVLDSLSRVRTPLFVNGHRTFSILDVIANVLLFVPVGFLLVGSCFRRSGTVRAWGVIASGFLAFTFSSLIEIGQLFEPGRVSSTIDVAADTTGALVGAVAASIVLGAAERRIGTTLTAVVHEEPLSLIVGLLVVVLAADRFYPFAVTLDVTTAWNSIRHAQVVPLASFRQSFWGDLLIDKTLIPAFLAALLCQVIARRRSARITTPAPVAWLLTTLFALTLEIAKVLWVGRRPNVDNVIVASLGALAGVWLLPRIVRSRMVGARPAAWLVVLALALLAYAELTPFDFALAPGAVSAKAHRVEWLPLSAYYWADPQSALFDLWNKLLLSGFLGFAGANLPGRPRLRPVAAGLAAGGLLEIAQVLKVTRLPSVSDVLVFGLGAYLGERTCQRYRTIRGEI